MQSKQMRFGAKSVTAAMARMRREKQKVRTPRTNTNTSTTVTLFLTAALEELSASLSHSAPKWQLPIAERSSVPALPYMHPQLLAKQLSRCVMMGGQADNTTIISRTDDSLSPTSTAGTPRNAVLRDSEGHLGPDLQEQGGQDGGMPAGDMSGVLEMYNPTLNGTLVRRVAAQLDIRQMLNSARHLVNFFQEVDAAFDIQDDRSVVARVLQRWKQHRHTHREHAKQVLLQHVDETAGIASRLHGTSATTGRRQPLRGFVSLSSDVQVTEVLPNGRVVTFTEPTTPGSPSRDLSMQDELRKLLTEGASGEDSSTGASAESTVFLHIVLYKESMSVASAVSTMAAAIGGTVTEEDFSFNIILDETAVTTQVCSTRVRVHHSSGAHSSGPTDASALSVATCTAMAERLVQVNLRPLRLAVQLLGWRRFACCADFGWQCRAQYAALIRGIQRHGRHIEAAAQTSAEGFPNYFSPAHFGPVLCPFRSYHVAEALECERYPEAIAMTLCLTQWPHCTPREGAASSPLEPWLQALVTTIRSGEDRSAVLRECWHRHVPEPVRAWLEAGKRDVVWNVLASCRVHQLANCGGSAVVVSTPEPGDFVFRSNRAQAYLPSHPSVEVINASDCTVTSVTKPELWAAVSTACGITTHRALAKRKFKLEDVPQAIPIFTHTEASSFTSQEIAIPFVDTLRQRCITVSQLERDLGFSGRRRLGGSGSAGTGVDAVLFRRLFVQATGYPRSHRPWVREYAEPPVALVASSGGAAHRSAEGSSTYHLYTDLDLVRTADGGRDYAERSRGRRAPIWPIGKRGRPFSDRLPAGLAAATSLAKVQRRSDASRCLALHLTLPADTYLSSLFREFLLLENRCSTVEQMQSETYSASPPVLEQHDEVPHVHGDAEDVHQLITGAPGQSTTDLLYEGNLMSLPVRGMNPRTAALRGYVSDDLSGGRSVTRRISTT